MLLFQRTGAATAILFLALLSASADDAKTGFIDKVYKGPDGKESKYVVFVPHDYKGSKDYPCILFLHGKGEIGTDNRKQIAVGLGKAVKKQEKTFPFITIFPQATKSWKADSPDTKRALAILDEVGKEYKVDKKRVYLTGLSMGGIGTWSIVAQYPDRWAAIVPICGFGDPKQVSKYKDVPCWCFHGDADPLINVEKSRVMIKAIKDAGGSPRYTEYPGVGHGSWNPAYATAELYEWLLKQSLK